MQHNPNMLPFVRLGSKSVYTQFEQVFKMQKFVFAEGVLGSKKIGAAK